MWRLKEQLEARVLLVEVRFKKKGSLENKRFISVDEDTINQDSKQTTAFRICAIGFPSALI